jgi:SAM-dependent methyltransferase
MLNLLGVLPPEGHILDFGCGPGAMALALAPRLGPRASYVGVDVHAPSVEWCRQRFAGDPRFRFEVARIASPYATQPGLPMARFLLPVGDGSVDLVIAKSVFTHLFPHEAAPLLAEIQRSLSAGGTAFVTAFLYEGGIVGTKPPAFRHRDPSGCVAWKRRTSAASAVAYENAFFDSLVTKAGLTARQFVAGFYPGQATRITSQDTLVLSRRN